MLAEKLKIMGGMFGWKDEKPIDGLSEAFLKEENIFMHNGRSAIYTIIKTLKPDNVWLPDYLCETVLNAAKLACENIKFYKITDDISVESTNWIEEIKNTDIVILIEYFGFPIRAEVIENIKIKKAKIIIDGAHSLLSNFNREKCDFVVYSPRKLVETPNGAIIETDNEEFRSAINLNKISFENLYNIYYAYQRRNIDFKSGEAEWFADYKVSEQSQQIGEYKIDDFSYSILIHGINYQKVADIRRKNFLFLLNELKDIAIFKQLPNNVVPLGFPVKMKNREKIQKVLYSNKIYPPVHWPVTQSARKYNQKLEEQELTLLCDQRYDIQDIEKMINLVKSNL